MKDLKLVAPLEGETLVVKLDGSYDTLSFGFSLENVFFERSDNDLVLSFDAGESSIVLKDFYTVFNSETAPQVVSQNGLIDGQSFLAQLGDDMLLAEAEGTIKQTRRENTESLEQVATSTEGFASASYEQDGIDLESFTSRVSIQLVGSRALASLGTSDLPDSLAPQVSIVLGTGADAFIMPSQTSGTFTRMPSTTHVPITGTITLKNMEPADLKVTIIIEGLGTYIVDGSSSDFDPLTGQFTIYILKDDLNKSTLKNPSFTFIVENAEIVSAPSNPIHLVKNYDANDTITVDGNTIANKLEGKTITGTDGVDRFAIGTFASTASTQSILSSLKGDDVIAIDQVLGSTINAGDGNDSISISYATGTTFKAIINAGSGNDTINVTRPDGSPSNAGYFSGDIHADDDGIGVYGDDKIVIDILGDSSISTYGGNDTVQINSITGTNTSIDGGEGIDTFIYGSNISHTFILDQYGNLRVDGFDSVTISGFENIILGSGDDNLTISAPFGTGGSVFSGTVNASAGNDTVTASSLNGMNITIDGGDGNDTFIYNNNSAGQTITLDNSGNVSIDGLASATITGFENITAGDGNDTIYGNDSNNYLYGGDGADDIYGGAGDDFIYGGAGNDTITGGAGHDVIYGGAGNDYLSGGAGADVFVWTADDISVGGTKDTVIADNEDSLDLRAFIDAGFTFSVAGEASVGGAPTVSAEITLVKGAITHTIDVGSTSFDFDAMKNDYDTNGFINL